MPTNAAISGRLPVGLAVGWALLLILAVGCGPGQYRCPEMLAERILPPEPVQPAAVVPPGPAVEAGSEKDSVPPAVEESKPVCPPGQVLNLHQAIDLVFRQQPRLRVYLESVEQARGAQDIAFAPFLPMALAGYSFGGFDLNVGGHSTPIGPLPGFTFLPAIGSVPIGLQINTGYELADVKLQWLICDFGRRIGRYSQASLNSDIAHLQCDRAYQTVANEVSVAFYQVLRARALRNSARAAVRRAEEELEEARKLAKKDVLVKEKELRAEVLLAETQQLLEAADGTEVVAVASLNLAIGVNVNAPTCPAENLEIPPMPPCLADCLQTAVGRRREFQVARAAIAVAEEGKKVSKADFAPRIVAEGNAFDFQQSDPRGHVDFALGFIKLEWGLFEGGKRVAELRVSDSKIRSAMAQAESIADTIAFQVTETYRNLVTARRGIDRSRPAVKQAEENYRIVNARFEKGDATSTEIVDAESTLTRAQMTFLNSMHDYLIALARLEYAMGVTPTPSTLNCPR